MHITQRSYWHARSPSHMLDKGNHPRAAFIHHSVHPKANRVVTLRQQAAAMRAIQNEHMDGNGWADIGYHYVVFQPYGGLLRARIMEARDTRAIPAAQLDHNTDTLAICVYGDFRTDEVKRNTKFAIEWLVSRFQMVREIGGHRDVFATECPGPHLYDALPHIAKALDMPLVKAH